MDNGNTDKVKMPPVAQVGIVVKDVDKVVTFYESTFGIGPWEIKEGESESTAGGSVHRYKTKVAVAQLGPVMLELFEVTEGRSPVHAEFLDRDREGVHHLGFFLGEEERERLMKDLAGKGVGVFQSSTIKGYGTVHFLDSAKVGGIFFELIPGPKAPAG